MDRPRKRYTAGREPTLAFEVLGDGGGVDLITVGPLLSHLELTWEEPSLTRTGLRLASLGRLVRFDRRNAGLSDVTMGPWTLADEVGDVIAVMDDAGLERAAVVSWLAGGPLACLLAATHPDRVAALVLDTCSPRQTYAEGYEWAPTREERARLTAAAAATWGEGDRIATFAPTWASDPAARAWMARLERMASAPGTMRRLFDSMNDVDVRSALSSIQAPTLVVRRRDDVRMDRRHSVYLAEHIEGARLVELDGQDSLPFGDGGDAWVDLIGEFVAGAPPPVPATRVMASLLFTDIVDSTAILARVGDSEWRALLQRHDALSQRAVAESNGRIVKNLGDGVFARFDGVLDAVNAARRLIADAAEHGLSIRAGVHAGDCELVGDDLAGRTVHETARISALAGGGEVLLSEAAHGLLAGADIEMAEHGVHRLKGFDDSYRLWLVTGR